MAHSKLHSAFFLACACALIDVHTFANICLCLSRLNISTSGCYATLSRGLWMQETPDRELKLARKRMKEVSNG